MEIIESISSLEKSFNAPNNGRISLESIQNVLDIQLASQNNKQLVELDLYKDQDSDEGEIMLLAMILLQLNGVKLPASEEENDVLNKKKRQRTSPDQLAILEQIFQTDKMPNQQTRVQLAGQLGMSSRRVQIWFQNKRAKVKRSVTKNDDGECSSPSSELSLNQSSSSLSPPSSPSSPSLLADESPLQSPTSSPAAPHNNPFKLLDASISHTVSKTAHTPTILDNTTKQLKAQQLQFPRTSLFTENQPMLTASY